MEKINVVTKPWMGREDGRLIVSRGHKVLFSTHYRNLKHRQQLINEINMILGGQK